MPPQRRFLNLLRPLICKATSVAKELYHKVGNHFREIPQIILVVLPSKSHNSYLPIKHVYDTGEGLKWGVQSQMLWDRHVIRVSVLLFY